MHYLHFSLTLFISVFSPSSSSSLGRYHRGRFYRGWGVGIGFFVVVTLIVLLSVSLSIRYKDNNSNDDNYFAPGDTRILSFSSRFCEGLRLSGDRGATLYLLEKKPPLSGPDNILKVQAPRVIDADSYRYLYYFLHRNSPVSLTYCLENDEFTALSFLLIKGKSNFDSWKEDGEGSHTVTNFDISNDCTGGKESFSYTVTSEDTYYFVFDNTDLDSSVTIQAEIELNRTEYLPRNVSIRDSCSINGDSCSVSVPYNSDYVALLEVGSDGIQPDDNVAFNWSCKARVWIYVLIVLLPLLFVVVALCVVLVVCVYCARKRSKNANYATLPAETPAPVNTTATTVQTTTTTTTAPPPMNPDYNPAPPGYGAQTNPDYNPAPPGYGAPMNPNYNPAPPGYGATGEQPPTYPAYESKQ